MNRLITLLLLPLLLPIAVVARENNPYIDPDTTPDLPYVDKSKPWQEVQVTPPPYPQDGDLVELNVDAADTPFRYLLDLEHLSLGADRVTRYTMVVVSRTGARNVLFEGIRCDTKAYVTYAYGTPDRQFRPAQDRSWHAITRGGGAGGYRDDLLSYYLCDRNHNPFSVRKVEQRVRYPAQAINPVNQ
jgi:hypothetical protein